eukprot:g15243.t1
MTDVAVAVLHVVAAIHDVAKDIKEADRQAWRLFERVTAIEPAVVAVKYGKKRLSSDSLRQLLETVEKIRNFLDEYAQTTKLNRALKRKSNATKFTDFGAMLSEGMQGLHLDVAVDAWANEDASDRLQDLENLIDVMEEMERRRTGNHAEVMGALKALQRDERSELTAWVEIDFDKDLDFEGSIRLGSGGFGEVRTAKWNESDVAVKHLLADGLRREDIRALRKEIRIHASLRFDHVIQLYAASTIAPHLCMVVELASGGSLWQYLHSTREPLPHAQQTAFLYDIARGMSFLHKKGILHRDLKSANVLVFANHRLKLCDFGLSRIKEESSSRSKAGAVGTFQWLSPEEMDDGPANELTDVYSFGVVCFEVATRVEPFKGRKPAQVMRAVLFRNERPEIPGGASASPDVLPLMERCWKQDPAERPEGFAPVVQELAGVVKRVGDPRNRNSDANDGTSSPVVKYSGGGAASIAASTAPLTPSDSLDASALHAMPVKRPMNTAAPPPAPPVQDATTDRAALMVLFKATAGPCWKKSGGWGTSVPLGRWHGVTVNGESRVVKLDLRNNNLNGFIPPALGRLKSLIALGLQTNKLTGSIPPELGGLKALREVAVYDNQLSGSIPSALGGLEFLTLLLLFSNKLNGPIPTALGGLTALERLELQGNNLTGPIPPALGGLTALKKLSLRSNNLSGPIPPELGRQGTLQRLVLSENQLSGPIPPALGGLTTLTTLHLNSNNLSGPIPAELGGLAVLETLNLERNQLGGEIPPALGGLKSLTRLGLDNNKLTGPIPTALDRLTALKELSLNDNNLRGAKADVQRMLPNCEDVSI